MSRPDPLAHLSETELDELMTRYYKHERVADLLETFGIRCHPSRLVRHFPPAPHTSPCPCCQGAMLVPRLPLSAMDPPRPYCTQCMHTEFPFCECEACEARRQAHREQLTPSPAALLTALESESHAQRFDRAPQELTLLEAASLLTLVRAGEWLDDNILTLPDLPPATLATRVTELENQIVLGLTAKGLASRLDRKWSAQVPRFRPQTSGANDYLWRLNMSDPETFLTDLDALVATDEAWPEHWRNDCLVLADLLAQGECLEFCFYQAAQRDLPLAFDEALPFVQDLLRTCSVSQCYQLVWNGTLSAVDYCVRRNLSLDASPSHLVRSWQWRLDRYRAMGWPIGSFDRNWRLGRSHLSHVLHDDFLKHGEVGFYACLRTLYPA